MPLAIRSSRIGPSSDSSLSASAESIVAAEVGEEQHAVEHFRFAVLVNLADDAGNASDGAHIAAAGGAGTYGMTSSAVTAPTGGCAPGVRVKWKVAPWLTAACAQITPSWR